MTDKDAWSGLTSPVNPKDRPIEGARDICGPSLFPASGVKEGFTAGDKVHLKASDNRDEMTVISTEHSQLAVLDCGVPEYAEHLYGDLEHVGDDS